MATSVEDIAHMCHETNRAWCRLNGDFSQVMWGVAPEWQKESAINGVEFKLKNPGALPSAQHDNWLKVKVAEGWKCGPVKDAEKKEHPCMVPYGELPEVDRRKDALFAAIVGALSYEYT